MQGCSDCTVKKQLPDVGREEKLTLDRRTLQSHVSSWQPHYTIFFNKNYINQT